MSLRLVFTPTSSASGVRASAALSFAVFALLLVFPSARAQQTSKPPKEAGAARTPQKANPRPDNPTAPAEPFDGATVEKMAAQCVKLETEAGVIEIEMLPEAAPESVRNFLNLVATGAYDTTTFSRVVKGFIIQGGNMTTRATLTPELLKRARRTVPDEPSAVKHLRGIVSMARGGEPNSATTHFFILAGDSPHLDGTFAAFGRVTRGMEVADAINQAPVEGDEPAKPVRITRAAVVPCPAPPPAKQ